MRISWSCVTQPPDVAERSSDVDGNANARHWALVREVLADGFPDAFEAVRVALIREKEESDRAAAAAGRHTCQRCGGIC